MSVDVSPDGKRIAFDLLGDIYELPIEGGEARALASGMAWDMQPRYSPDGKWIAFTSDRAGGDNLWIMDANGGGARQITKESFRLLNNPVWHPSGRYVAGRKHFTTRRSLGTGEIWLYSLDGGDGVLLVKRPSDEFQKELGEPAFSPDGRYLYYTQNVTPGPIFEYAQDVNRAVFAIRRYEAGHRRSRRCRERARRRGASDALARRPLARVRASRAHAERVRDGAVRQGPRVGRRAVALHGPRSRHAGNVGRPRPLSEHGLDARQQEHRVLGRRRHQAHRRRIGRGARHSVPRRGHARDDRAAAPRRRGRAG